MGLQIENGVLTEAHETESHVVIPEGVRKIGLLALAIEKKATKCTAVLLDFKNSHFPEYADVSEFSLDW